MTGTADADVFPGALEEQLLRRLGVATAKAQHELGVPVATDGGRDLDLLRSLIETVSRRLAGAPGGSPDQLRSEHSAALERLRQRFDARFDALARVQAVIGELRELTSPSSMLSRAPAALCGGSTLRRAVLSLIRGGRMVAQTAYFVGDEAGARAALAELSAHPPRLEHPLIETELLRRRRATIVDDAHVHPRVDRRLAETMAWRSYAAAPLVVGSSVIGVIHADRGREQQLDVLDRDVLWEFATGLAQAYESATLRRTLRREREQMRQFLEWLNARSGELTDAPVTFATGTPVPLPPPQPLDRPAPAEGRDDRVVFEGLLTRRELDVLRLLAEGKANKGIAAALVIADGTVKFHVNSILRKLRAANRAEAVSTYLRLLGMKGP
jgi:LuxR family transcriptional regulator, regulator of acetate metabolism